MGAGTKIKNLEAQIASVQPAYQRLPRSETVMLIALPAPAKDYLCLSITAFCFCILLAIPALLFSLKVGTTQLLVFSLSSLFMSHRGISLPSHHLAVCPFCFPRLLGPRLHSLILCPSWLLLPHPPVLISDSPGMPLSSPISFWEPSCLFAFTSTDPGSQLCWRLEASPEELHAGLGLRCLQHPCGMHFDGQLY